MGHSIQFRKNALSYVTSAQFNRYWIQSADRTISLFAITDKTFSDKAQWNSLFHFLANIYGFYHLCAPFWLFKKSYSIYMWKINCVGKMHNCMYRLWTKNSIAIFWTIAHSNTRFAADSSEKIVKHTKTPEQNQQLRLL